MLSKLNGWQRIGVVLSCLWVAFIFSIVFIEYGKSHPDSGFFKKDESSYQPITDESIVKDANGNLTFSAEDAYKGVGNSTSASSYSLRVGNIASIIFIPLVISWLFVYILIYTVKWVALGFKRKT